MKLRAYFAHPYKTIGSEGEKRIIDILEERKVKVINPFDTEDDVLEKYNDKPLRKLGRDIWIKDLNQISKCNIFVVWMPDMPVFGCAAELQYALEWQKEKREINRHIRMKTGVGFDRQDEPYLIQMITKRKNPLIAYAIDYGNQLFETIDEFDKLQISRWD